MLRAANFLSISCLRFSLCDGGVGTWEVGTGERDGGRDDGVDVGLGGGAGYDDSLWQPRVDDETRTGETGGRSAHFDDLSARPAINCLKSCLFFGFRTESTQGSSPGTCGRSRSAIRTRQIIACTWKEESYNLVILLRTWLARFLPVPVFE